ncbi:hypothetical protein QI037_10315 [Staphylococcus saprophyticus]|uniref:Phage protein n=1 Tax=Staphylococcus cohnii TaxID=29382 RepID=A0ABT6J236_9STAP|nr:MULTISPECIES: hypothetical protein [Staphylococcus]CRV31902.1 Uncharacterised protein [Streptococcus equi subsp. equi]AKR47469.1 hypothetical protein ACO02_2794 [Staphylococcus aureus]AOH63316.1 hypothetical protein A7U52_2959 [Staphylococcus aureus]AUI14291.1 hypothetical protein A7U46_015090 [Staphylococcus aureus]EVV84578.1 hypothetical protein U205_02720 [Staphylococcus aureus T34696]
MATNKIQQRYRIDGKYIDMISQVEKDNNLNSKGAALEYLLEENIRLKQLLSEKNHENITEDTSKILKAINQSSKDIKAILEFANTYAYREVIEENISATESPTNWLNEAQEEVSKQIQLKRTHKLSEH